MKDKLKKVRNKAGEIWDEHGDAITGVLGLCAFGYTCYSVGKLDGYLGSLFAVIDGVTEAASENKK